VAGFQASDKLAAAYGLAVTGTMSVTTVAYFVVVTRAWRWPLAKAIPLCATFMAIDLTFLLANLRKFLDGGWVPFSIGLAVFTVFTTWMAGRKRLGERVAAMMIPLDEFLAGVGRDQPPRVRGVAVFLTANTGGVPALLRHHYKHNQVLHETVILLTITSAHTPFVKAQDRFSVESLDLGFHRLVARFGYMETPIVPDLLRGASARGLHVDLDRTTYYLGRETILASTARGMARWRKRLFGFVSRNATTATAYFGIPPDRVVELGMQIDL
jgi:KUP system potassium uptake protein